MKWELLESDDKTTSFAPGGWQRYSSKPRVSKPKIHELCLKWPGSVVNTEHLESTSAWGAFSLRSTKNAPYYHANVFFANASLLAVHFSLLWCLFKCLFFSSAKLESLIGCYKKGGAGTPFSIILAHSVAEIELIQMTWGILHEEGLTMNMLTTKISSGYTVPISKRVVLVSAGQPVKRV